MFLRTTFQRCAQSVPDGGQIFAGRSLQGLERLDELWTLERTAEQSEAKAPVAQICNDGQLLPAEAVLRDRCLASRGPRPRATRSAGQTPVVDAEDYSPVSRCVFCSGHLLALRLRAARSLRSRASPAGRCTLQPSPPSNRQAEEARIFTGNSLRSVARSAATSPAPSESRPPVPLLCAVAPTPGAVPRSVARGSRCNAPIPSWRARSQRIAIWRETPPCQATSARRSRSASNLAPRRRRRSSAFSFSAGFLRSSNGYTLEWQLRARGAGHSSRSRLAFPSGGGGSACANSPTPSITR